MPLRLGQFASITNPWGTLYINGDATTEGSRRYSVNPDTNIPVIEKLIDGIWQPTSFEAGPDTIWAGLNVGIGKTPIDYPLEILSTAPVIKLENSRTIMGNGYNIGTLLFNAGESTHQDVAEIRVNATEDWTDTSSPTRMAFYITPVGAILGQQAMLIDENSNVEIEGSLKVDSLPTSDPVVAGSFWNDSGNVKVSAGV